MSNPKYDQLIKQYPKILSNVQCGIYYGDGWHNLISNLCLVIEHEINRMPIELQDQFIVDQIKQKFGSLRFYMSRTTPYMDGAIELAESMSRHICEVCGNSGHSQTVRAWTAALCDPCYKIKLDSK